MSAPAESTDRVGSRAETQRDRILCAALQCFIEHGFHAASMANIADAAGMSAGLMYRYFDNKNAIVLAIVERQLKEKRTMIQQLHSSHDIAAGLLKTFEQWSARDASVMSVALFLEMSAEATRNPQIAEALRTSDALTRADFEAWLSRSRADGGLGLPADVAASRALLVRWVVDGLALRAARDPGLDVVEVRTALEDLFGRLLH